VEAFRGRGRGESSDCNFRLPTKEILPGNGRKDKGEVVKSKKKMSSIKGNKRSCLIHVVKDVVEVNPKVVN